MNIDDYNNTRTVPDRFGKFFSFQEEYEIPYNILHRIN